MDEKEGHTGKKEQIPDPKFSEIVLSIATSALVYLGAVEEPLTKKKEFSPEMAQHTIDLLGILEEKTKGNLTREEEAFLSAVLADLRIKFVEAMKQQKVQTGEGGA